MFVERKADFLPPPHPLEHDAWRSDRLLSDESQAEVRELLEDVTLALAQVQRDLRDGALQITPDQLHEERNRYLDRIKKLRSAIAPHKKLPPEILLKIFKDCSPSPLCLPVGPHLRNGDGDDRPWSFSLPIAICSRWRQIAISSRDLWDDLVINYPPFRPRSATFEKITSAAEGIMARGTRFLAISVDDASLLKEDDPLSRLVIPFSLQLTRIELKCAMSHLSIFMESTSPPFPALESLILLNRDGLPPPPLRPSSNPLIMFEQCPNLKLFMVDQFYLDFLHLADKMPLPWGQLAELKFPNTWISLQTAHWLVSRCSSLVTCWLSILFMEDIQDTISNPLPMITHVQLQTLTMSSTSGSPNVAAALFQSLRLPSLRSFTITNRNTDDSLASFISLISRSQSPLRTFSAPHALISPTVLHSLLEMTRELEILEIPKTIFSISMLERMALGVMLPRLTRLDCVIHRSPQSLESFMDAVERVRKGDSEATPLQAALARCPQSGNDRVLLGWPQAIQRFKKLDEKLRGEERLISVEGLIPLFGTI